MAGSDESPTVHNGIHRDCPHHENAALCAGVTQNRKPCKFRWSIIRSGVLPVCGKHLYYWIPSERCQALEVCGHVCNRQAPVSEPYHLCRKHQQGTDTLPCPIMNIPVEIRLMVFRYLFPKTVSADDARDVKVGILRLNKQIYIEASSVLYSETQFKATVETDRVSFLGYSWRPSVNVVLRNGLVSDTDMLLRHSIAQNVRHLDLDVRIGSNQYFRLRNGIDNDEYHIYQGRDTMRNFLRLLLPPPGDSSSRKGSLRNLTVRPHFSHSVKWCSKEKATALFLMLEPLQSLHGVQAAVIDPIMQYSYMRPETVSMTQLAASSQYKKLRDSWLRRVANSNTTYSLPPGIHVVSIIARYQQLEKVLRQLQTKQVVNGNPWLASAFERISQPMHFARVAYENGDLKAMIQVQRLVAETWITAHRKHSQSLANTADLIGSMLEENGDKKDLRDDYPGSFNLEFSEETKRALSRSKTQAWSLSILQALDDAPSPTEDDDVIITSKELRVRLTKGNRSWVRLKTPAMRRELAKTREKQQISSEG